MITPQIYGSLMLLLVSFTDPVESVSCGQSCCYLLLNRLEKPITMADLDRDFAKLKTETSFQELENVLKIYGVSTTSWKLDWELIRSIRGPFIAHIDDPKSHFRHYHVAEWNGSELVVLDPLAAKPIHVTTDSALEAYRTTISGNVLVPSAGVPSTWYWRSQLRVASIGLAAVIGCVWFLWHRSAKKSQQIV